MNNSDQEHEQDQEQEAAGSGGASRGSLRKAALVLLATTALAAHCQGQDWLDALDNKLRLASKNGLFRSELTGLFDLEGYYIDQRPPGLLDAQQSFINPRATFFVDTTLGHHLYSLVQARIDRGFDPAANPIQARFDEYLLRYTPFDDSRVSLQFGEFATVVGNWVQRHDSWANPLITAPLPYENVTTVSDLEAPASPADFLARRGQPDDKEAGKTAIWGPVYATGGALLGNIGKMDYAFDFKNAALSSHPDEWYLGHRQWQHPSVSGRLGVRPNAAWNQGVSFSVGPYLERPAESSLRPGQSIGDFDQITLASDVSYAWHRWQLWAELFLTRFEVPNVGNADILTYYLEAKYKITSGLFAAARWNQQVFGTVSDGMGGRETWNSDMIRIDLALGYRFTRHLQSKIQYSFGHRDASLQQGEQLVAAQVTLKF